MSQTGYSSRLENAIKNWQSEMNDLKKSAYDDSKKTTYRDGLEILTDYFYTGDAGKGYFAKPKYVDTAVAASLSPYAFRMGSTFGTYRDALMYYFASDEKGMEKDHDYNQKYGATDPNSMVTMLCGDNDPAFVKFSVTDTSLGGNDAINCRWAFGRDDDIIHPLNALLGNPARGGLGRVYREIYDHGQQLLHIGVGVPEFSDLVTFYTECVEGNLMSDVNAGGSNNVTNMMQRVGGMLGWPLKIAFNIAMFPLRFPEWIADKFDGLDRITKYYEIRPSMPMYYKYANAIFQQIAVLMGMAGAPFYFSDDAVGAGDKSNNGSQSGTPLQILHKASRESTPQMYRDSLPPMMQEHGPSVYRILSKKDHRYGLLKAEDGDDVDKYISQAELLSVGNNDGGGGLFDGFSNRLHMTKQGADKFISFRVNKTSDSTETVTNSTGPSSIAQTINSAASKGADTRFSAGGHVNKLFAAISSVPLLGDVVGAVGGFAKGLVNSVGIVGLAGAVITGSGFVDIPDIWTGSSFSKNYSFNMTFRAGAADPNAILQDCYLPLSLLLAMSCPRSVGVNSYTSPFLVRAYCKGMFAVPLGIIDSMTITRGASEFGWNFMRLPTVINVSMTIKDLAPIMHLAMMDSFYGWKIFAANSSMQEYAHTLAGSGLNERLLFSESISQRLRLCARLVRTTLGDPIYWATAIGNSSIPRILSIFNRVSGYVSK